MKILLQMLIVKGVFLVLLATYIAYKACNPETLMTEHPNAMAAATIILIVGIVVGFGSWMVYDHEKLNGWRK